MSPWFMSYFDAFSNIALFVAFFNFFCQFFLFLDLQYQINIALFVAFLKFFPLYIG